MEYRPDKYRPLEDELARGNVDPGVREEIRHHLAMRVEHNLAAGMTREDAEADARRRFGDVERYRAETGVIERSLVVRGRRRERLADRLVEVRRALRSLRRSPTFSLTALVTLALSIAAATAIYAVLDAVVLRPLPYPGASRMVRIYHPVPGVSAGARWNVSQAELFFFRRESRTLSDVAAFDRGLLTLVANGATTPVRFGGASPGLLSLLGVRPLLGRLFTEADSEQPAEIGLVLSESFWRSRFGADPSVVGRAARLEGNDVRIIGVTAGSTGLPDWPVEAWGAIELDPRAPARNNHYLHVVAKLRDGVSTEEATRELAGFVGRYAELFPTAYTEGFLSRSRFGTVAVPWTDDVVGGAGTVLWTLFAAVAIVLLIACFNVGNLFVVRGQARARETAVRRVLGARTGQVVWHHLTESLLLSLGAGAIGVALSWAALRGFLLLVPSHLTRTGAALPRLGEVSLGWSAVGFAAAVSLLAGIGFGLGQLAAGPSSERATRGSGRTVTASRRELWVRGALVMGQITFAVILLSAAGLMIRTFRNLRAVEPGFDPTGVLAMDLSLPFGRYQRYEEATPLFRRLIERIRELPGVVEAGIGSDLPLESGDGCSSFAYREQPATGAPCVMNLTATPGYAAALGLAIEGREPTWSDLESRSGAAMVSEALARRLWGDGPALGREIKGPMENKPPYYRVVGVVKGLRLAGLEQPPVEFGYFPIEPIPGAPLWGSPLHRGALVVKLRGVPPVAVAPRIEAIVRELDPEVALANGRTMETVLARSLLRVRLLLVLLGTAAAVALLLSAVGLYGVIAYVVSRRSPEIGIRIALGATASTVRRQVVEEAAWFSLAGGLAGAAASLVVTGYLRSVLFGVTPADPLVLAGAPLVLLAVAFAASLIPAQRATRINPLEAIRAE